MKPWEKVMPWWRMRAIRAGIEAWQSGASAADLIDAMVDALGETLEARLGTDAPPPRAFVMPAEERLCRDRAMAQWRASLKRPDLTEEDRVRGAIEAHQRQALAIMMLTDATQRDGALWPPEGYDRPGGFDGPTGAD